MRRAIERMIRSYVPEGVLDSSDVSDIATSILKVFDDAPRYLRAMFKGFFLAHLMGPNPSWTSAKLLEGIGSGRVRRTEHWIAQGNLTVVLTAIYSHPKVLAALGIKEGLSKGAGTDTRLLPHTVETIDLADLGKSHRSADVIVIGSGPGGAMTALRLAEAGHSVLVLEAGERPSGERRSLIETMGSHYAYGGTMASMGPGPQFIPVLTGRVVGGSAHLNMATCLVPSPEVFRSWGIDPDELTPHFEAVKALIGAQPADTALMGTQNVCMGDGCRRLGYQTSVIPRNAINRDGAAVSMVGGETANKLSPERSLLPRAVAAGARIVTRAPVRRIERQECGHPLVYAGEGPRSTTFTAYKAVVFAGGSIGTPHLLLRSGFKNGTIGRAAFFQLNSNVLGKMDRTVDSHVGIEQGLVCREWEDEGVVIESVSTPPALAASYLPGRGKAHWEQMREYRKYCQLGFIADAVNSPVSVSSVMGEPFLRHRLDPRDAEWIRFGFRTSAEILFAGGAERVLFPGGSEWCATPAAARKAIAETADEDLHLVSVHLIGTCRMGRDSRASVVGLDGRMHAEPSLWIADGSILPSALGVNPQLTIMAMAHRNAQKMIERLK